MDTIIRDPFRIRLHQEVRRWRDALTHREDEIRQGIATPHPDYDAFLRYSLFIAKNDLENYDNSKQR